MKRIYISILCAFCFTIINAEDIEIECDNFVSSQVNESVVDAPIVRPLNGGSVIVPSFSYSCPNEITVYSIFGEKMYSGKESDFDDKLLQPGVYIKRNNSDLSTVKIIKR